MEEENAWQYLDAYVSRNYSDCSSFPQLVDGFGVRKDGEKKELWEVVEEALNEYDQRLNGFLELAVDIARIKAEMEANSHKMTFAELIDEITRKDER
jgi:hypothetical protein